MQKEGIRYEHTWKLLDRACTPLLPTPLAVVPVVGSPLCATISPICPTNLVVLTTLFDIERDERIKSATVTIFSLLPNNSSNGVTLEEFSDTDSDVSDDSSDDDSDSDLNEVLKITPKLTPRLLRHYNRFTYAPIPHPTFSSCGEIYPAVANTTHDSICCSGYHMRSSHIQGVILKYKGGNLCGKVLACLNTDSIFIFLINYRMNNIVKDCYIAVFKMKDNFTLRFQWHMEINSVIHDLLDDTWIREWYISPNGKKLLALLNNGSLNVIDLIEKKNIFCKNLMDIFEYDFHEIPKYFCSVFYPFYSENIILITVDTILYLYDWKCNTILYKNILPNLTDCEITHVSISKNNQRMSLCCQNGHIFIYRLRELTLKTPFILEVDIPPLYVLEKAISASFTCTSEELCACYSSENVLLWQLPRIINLREMCRLKIRMYYKRNEIENFQIPNILKKYLLFQNFKN